MEGLISTNRFHGQTQISEGLAKDLAGITALEVIQFNELRPNEQTLYNLNEYVFKKRKDITLRVYGYGGAWKDINFLKQLPQLERFNWESDEFLSVKPLYELNKLVHLRMGFAAPKQKFGLAFLVDFKDTLEGVGFHGDYKDFLLAIPKLNNLKKIWLSSMKLKDFGFLAGLPIETFGNYGSRVESFDFLSQLPTLKNIWIKTNTTLENIDFISELRLLKVIELYYISKITHFPNCDHLNNLMKIIAAECNRLSDIDEILKLTNCKISVYGKLIPGKFYRT